ncbi:hypothetical protein [Nonomuraea sp. NEAU-A123]|uniref:hypothetical protein n=1 Tax=Nonomuraea sp. NEAU-A123 TaxID=2839649 RepID=UPI001BE4CC43|nr:hypothetical protein [Nonomuraea sp. NEAU-A123]MBT2234988.1 hypothetical protein [Nonomuraea sp. NEAU-A123]
MSAALTFGSSDMSVLEMIIFFPFITIVFTPVVYLALTIAPFFFSFVFCSPPKDLIEPKNRPR